MNFSYKSLSMEKFIVTTIKSAIAANLNSISKIYLNEEEIKFINLLGYQTTFVEDPNVFKINLKR